MTTRDHQEVQVGGPLNEERLRAIMVRGYLLRNLCVSPEEAFTYKDRVPLASNEIPPWSEYPNDPQHVDGETPTLVHCQAENETWAHCELHVGCGENCPIMLDVPFDPDSGGVPSENAVAVAHAGRDLIDLVREVLALRKANAHTHAAADEYRKRAEGAQRDRDTIHAAYLRLHPMGRNTGSDVPLAEQTLAEQVVAMQAEALKAINAARTGIAEQTLAAMAAAPRRTLAPSGSLGEIEARIHQEADTWRRSTPTPAPDLREAELFTAHLRTITSIGAYLERLEQRIAALEKP